jgi:hypothetical protein
MKSSKSASAFPRNLKRRFWRIPEDFLMSTPTLSLTESQALAALRAFLLSALPEGTEVTVRDNRVPEPIGTDFGVMTPTLRERLSTNVLTYRDRYPDAPGEKDVLQATKLTVQLDVHGPASADSTQIIDTLWRDATACDALAASGLDLAPLYASEPRQIPFVNGEQRVETHWSVDLVMQVSQVVTVPQDFAAALEIGDAGHSVTAATTAVEGWNGLIDVDTRLR